MATVLRCFADSEELLPRGAGKQVAVFVALCDNEHQGIDPVPARIGNGEDAANNLYWGCSDALPKVLRVSREWGRPKHYTDYASRRDSVIDTMVCTRADGAATLYAYAYRGDSIVACMRDFETALASA